MTLLLGDSLERLKELEANSVDSVVCDPPYGLAFMNKKWDYDVPSVELWREVLRVLKPGGHLLSFGGTRTYHRMVVAIEDAGFEIRDMLSWLYGSGFPKSMDVSKAIDKQAGAEREVVGLNPNHRGESQMINPFTKSLGQNGNLTAPATDDAKRWQGFGTALKPAVEPIVMARKPLEKGLTVAANVLKHGTGSLNIDASRIGIVGGTAKANIKVGEVNGDRAGMSLGKNISYKRDISQLGVGRWPANLILDERAAEMLDEQSGNLGKSAGGNSNAGSGLFEFGQDGSRKGKPCGFGDSGGASRFFLNVKGDPADEFCRFIYQAKASKRERNAGLEGMPVKIGEKNQELGPNAEYRQANAQERAQGITHVKREQNQNHHPTVKPIKLCEYLVRMITPPGGTCLDCFMGSGSTGVAAARLGFNFIGIEREAEYLEIAKRRIDHALKQSPAQDELPLEGA